MANIRDISADTLRGLAIFTMVAANLAGNILIEPHPSLFRFYGTFAAPMFILIAGMMVSTASSKTGHGFKYYLLRSGLILSVAALIDLAVWNLYPFIGVDVLYLIGISLPLAYLSLKLSIRIRVLLVAIIFSATPILQGLLGYASYPADFDLYLWVNPSITSAPSILHHWVIDGWFPIFPWLGFTLLGTILMSMRQRFQSIGKNMPLLLGISILAVGSLLWVLYPGSLFTRDGYSEMFYPATIGFILTAVGLIVTLFSLVDRKPNLAIYKPLQVLGEVALFIYIFHYAIIGLILEHYLANSSFILYLATYAVFIVSLIGIAYGLRLLKSKWKQRPFLIRFLIG